MRYPNWLRSALLVSIMTLVTANSASACPNCSRALADQDETKVGNVAAGYSRSILLMIAVPFTMLGAGTVAIVRVAKRGGIPQL